MAFSGSFTTAQSADGQNIVLTDTSSYSSEAENTFSDRRAYLWKIDGTTLVPAGTTTQYVDWPFGVGSILTIEDVLANDVSLTIEVVWVSTNPQVGSTYNAQEVNTFLYNTKTFAYGQLQRLAAAPVLNNDTNFKSSFATLNNEIENAERATEYDDQFCAQSAIERANYLIQNENKFF